MTAGTFGALARGRDNNFNLARMLAAAAVLGSHSVPLAVGPGVPEPLLRATGFTLGTLAVQIFFAISGFFIAASFERKTSLRDFTMARVLRLFPALAVVLMLTVSVIGPAFTVLPLATYVRAPATWSYVPANLALRVLQEELPGVFPHNPSPLTTNGSLWTLYSEVKCYVLVAAAGSIGLLRPRFFPIIFAGFLGYQLHGRLGDPFALQAGFVRLSLPFFAGVACHVYRGAIPCRGWLAATLIVAAAATKGLPLLYAMLAPVALSYTALWFGFAAIPLIRGYNRLGDYSYGLYVYAWPVQQMLVATFAITAPSRLAAAAFAVTLVPAILSWHLVEKPALRRRPGGLIRHGHGGQATGRRTAVALHQAEPVPAP